MKKATKKKKVAKKIARRTNTKVVKGTKVAKDGRTLRVAEDGKMITNTPIYTEEFVRTELEGMLEYAHEHSDVVFIGELFASKVYTRQRFSEWAKKFEKVSQISDTIEKIEELLEARVAKGGITGLFNANFTKFFMINNHDWKDKSEVDNTHRIPTLGDIFDAADKRRDGGE